MMTDSIPFKRNQELKFPRAFLSGKVDLIRFHETDVSASNIPTEKFVEAVDRSIVRDVKLIVGYNYISAYHKTFAKAERIECEVWARELGGDWKQEQKEVLYIVGTGSDKKVIKQYN